MAGEGDAGKALLSSAAIRHALGSGSNGCVLLATFPDPSAAAAAGASKIAGVPTDGRKCALKLMSHFWDDNAKMLLDCERRTLAHLPPHPGVVRVYSEFPTTIPEGLSEYITTDMRNAAAADRDHTTQAFLFAYHPTTLDKFRSVLPLPVPWPLMWRMSRDLVTVVAHMEAHHTAHLDLKLDNILVAYDGRCVLTDFGISRVFDSAELSLVYSEPFDLLMNRLVLAPEVLISYERAKAAVKRAGKQPAAAAAGDGASAGHPPAGDDDGASAATDADDRTIGFAWQGIWSVGVVLYEIAAGYGHEPGYPDDGSGTNGMTAASDAATTSGRSSSNSAASSSPVDSTGAAAAPTGNMRGNYYSLAGVPPLPVRDLQAEAAGRVDGDGITSLHPPVASVFSRAADGSLRHRLQKVPHESVDGSSEGAVAHPHSLPSLAGYPSEFCALLLSMLEADPARRVSATDALALLDAMQPVYRLAAPAVTSDEADVAAQSEASSGAPAAAAGSDVIVTSTSPPGGAGGSTDADASPQWPQLPIEGFPVRLPDDGIAVVNNDYGVLYAGESGVYLAEADAQDNTYVPVLLRHTSSGACRLLRCHPDMPLESILDYWGSGAPVAVMLPLLNLEACSSSGSDGAGDSGASAWGTRPRPSLSPSARYVPYSTLPVPGGDDGLAAVKSCRLFLGGCELLNRAARLEAVVNYLLQDDSTEPLYRYPPYDRNVATQGGKYAHSIRPAVVLDLFPREAEVVATSAAYLLGQLSEAQRLAEDEAAAAEAVLMASGGDISMADGGISSDMKPLLVSSNAEVLPPPPPPSASAVEASFGERTSRSSRGAAASAEPAAKRFRTSFEPTGVDTVETPTAPLASSNCSSNRIQQLIAWLQSYDAAYSSSSVSSAGPSRHPLALVARPPAAYTIDMQEAVLHRSLLGLTSVCNDALKDPSIDFPFTAAAAYAVQAVRAYSHRHDTVSAAIGLLRNVSCMEQPAVAVELAHMGAVEACVTGFFGRRPVGAKSRLERPRSDVRPTGTEDMGESAGTAEAPSAADSSTAAARKRAGTAHTAAATLSDGVIFGTRPEAPSASNSSNSSPLATAPVSIHGDDPRVAEDAVLAASNLLRFDEVQALTSLWSTPSVNSVGKVSGDDGGGSTSLPYARAAALAAGAMTRHPDAQTLNDSGARLLRYLLGIQPSIGGGTATVAGAIASAGALHALVPGLTQFAADRTMVELLLHVNCSLLVFEEVRSPSLCPYRECASAVVALMSKTEYVDDEAVLGLGATVLRNLACVPASSLTSASASSDALQLKDEEASFSLSPALVVTQAGAAAALEATMERHPSSQAIQENGRCALYNLLLISSNDATGIISEARRLAEENAELRAKLLATSSLALVAAAAAASSSAAAPAPPAGTGTSGLPAAARPRGASGVGIAAHSTGNAVSGNSALSPAAAASSPSKVSAKHGAVEEDEEEEAAHADRDDTWSYASDGEGVEGSAVDSSASTSVGGSADRNFVSSLVDERGRVTIPAALLLFNCKPEALELLAKPVAVGSTPVSPEPSRSGVNSTEAVIVQLADLAPSDPAPTAQHGGGGVADWGVTEKPAHGGGRTKPQLAIKTDLGSQDSAVAISVSTTGAGSAAPHTQTSSGNTGTSAGTVTSIRKQLLVALAVLVLCLLAAIGAAIAGFLT